MQAPRYTSNRPLVESPTCRITDHRSLARNHQTLCGQDRYCFAKKQCHQTNRSGCCHVLFNPEVETANSNSRTATESIDLPVSKGFRAINPSARTAAVSNAPVTALAAASQTHTRWPDRFGSPQPPTFTARRPSKPVDVHSPFIRTQRVYSSSSTKITC